MIVFSWTRFEWEIGEAGFRIALTRGLKAYAEIVGNKKASIITTDDVIITHNLGRKDWCVGSIVQ